MAKTIRPKVLRAFACRQDILLKLTIFLAKASHMDKLKSMRHGSIILSVITWAQ